MEDIFEELAAVGSDDEGRADENDQGGSGNRDDEAEEANDTRRVVKPKRVVSRPRPKLDPARLLGPRGIFTINSSFENMKFKGKGHELDDLNNILSRLQHWAHRLFPKMTFEDCIERIEELGHKREIQTNMHKIRMGMIDLDSGQPTRDEDDADERAVSPPPDDNAFDLLIAAAPAPAQTTLTEEQRARMMRNRLLAEERRMARRLAKEKELEEQRQVATRAAESSSAEASDNIEAPVVDAAATSAGSPEKSHVVPSCVFDDTAPDPNTAGTSRLDEEPRNLDDIDNGASGSLKSSYASEGGSDAADAGVHDSPSCSHADSTHGESSKATKDPDVDECNTAHMEAKISTSKLVASNDDSRSDAVKRLHSNTELMQSDVDSPSNAASETASKKAPQGNVQGESKMASKVVHKLSLGLAELMEVEHSVAKDNTGNATLDGPVDIDIRSTTDVVDDAAKPGASDKTVTASAFDELMDIGTAEDWEEAFAEEERALASQSQPK